MPRYRIPCTFLVFSELIVEAESLGRAAEVGLNSSSLPPQDQWEYVNDSFSIQEDDIEPA